MNTVMTEREIEIWAMFQPLIEDTEAHCLEMYVPTVREYDQTLDLFKLKDRLPLTAADISATSLPAIDAMTPGKPPTYHGTE